MKIIIPMAGMGKRMRPHTFSTPKPLLKIAGKSIVERIVEDLASSTKKSIDEIHFVIGNFGIEAEERLIKVAQSVGAKGFIHYQDEPLGTAHAVYCAESGLDGEVIVAFADTLFIGNFEINETDDGIIWAMEVKNPEQYGVVIANSDNIITHFVEKPKEFVSNKAIIGIYYFKEGKKLKDDIKLLIDNKLMKGGEYQLTDSLKNLSDKGVSFKCKTISEWLDCGNKEEFLVSNRRILDTQNNSKGRAELIGSLILEPVFIGKGVILKNAKVGPFVSLGDKVVIENSVISNSIIGTETKVLNAEFTHSIIGNNSTIINGKGKFNLGDYSSFEGI